MRLHPIALGDHDNTDCVSVCARRRTPAWRVHRLLWTRHIVLLCVLPTCCRGGGGGGPTPGGQGVIQNEGEGRGLGERWFARGLRLTGRRGKVGTQYACAANSRGEEDDEDEGGRQGETRVESNDSGSQRNTEEAVERVHASADGAGGIQAPTALKEAFYSRLSGEDNLWGALARRPVTKVNVYGVGSFAAPQRHPLAALAGAPTVFADTTSSAWMKRGFQVMHVVVWCLVRLVHQITWGMHLLSGWLEARDAQLKRQIARGRGKGLKGLTSQTHVRSSPILHLYTEDRMIYFLIFLFLFSLFRRDRD
mmetsp:Transcript_64828/g.104942  ORF Transcript_64828/g.104942 Transcript_64828/m.104942 type:complete len:308 (-) Transcript_64828:11-934(-)